jgi:hypothetical protein
MPTNSNRRNKAPATMKPAECPGKVKLAKALAKGNSEKSPVRPSSVALVPVSCGTLPDGSPLEFVRPAACTQLQLVRPKGQKISAPSKTVTIGTQRYTPTTLESSWALAIHFPRTVGESRPTSELFGAISEFFQKGLTCPPGTAELITAFVVGTWFADLIYLPPLWVLAPDAIDRTVLLERLSCVCRQSLLLADCSRATVASLPPDLKPTLLFEVARASAATPVLAITSRHGFYVTRRNRALDNALAVGVASGDPPDTDMPVLKLMFPPGSARDSIGNAANLEEESAALQAALARYRLEQYRNLPHTAPELKALTRTGQVLAASLTARIEDSTVRDRIVAALQQQDEQVRAERSTELHAIALEALLAPCHRQEKEMLVGDFSELDNAILEGRGQAPRFTPRAFGQLLRSLGLTNARRTKQGWSLPLDTATRGSIHRIASTYGVETPAQAECEECCRLYPPADQQELGERGEHGALVSRPMARKYSQWHDYLTNAGCPLLPAFVKPNLAPLELRQAGHCWVREGKTGAIFDFDLELRAWASCTVDRFALQVPGWSPKDFHFLEANELDSYLREEFAGYPPEEVLNRLAERHTKLDSGSVRRGMLLGHALDQIPQECRSPLTVIVSVYDTSENVTCVHCVAGLTRMQVKKQPAQRPKYSGGLMSR